MACKELTVFPEEASYRQRVLGVDAETNAHRHNDHCQDLRDDVAGPQDILRVGQVRHEPLGGRYGSGVAHANNTSLAPDDATKGWRSRNGIKTGRETGREAERGGGGEGGQRRKKVAKRQRRRFLGLKMVLYRKEKECLLCSFVLAELHSGTML